MLYIMQENYLKTVADRNNNDAEAIKMDKMDDLVTSGPYKKYFDNDQNVVLIRDDNYWGQADSMWSSQQRNIFVKQDVKLTEPPDAEPHVRWCERSAAKAASYSIQ